MRVMECESTGAKLKIEKHLILANGWEYYLEKEDRDGVAFGFVMGFENEMGSVYVPELTPYLLTKCEGNDLHDIFPASGWKWVDNG